MSDREEYQGPSRSAKKRAAKAVEELAWKLVDLPEAEWNRLPAAGELRTEIGQARATGGHGSRKRQVKHLAGVLRRREDEAQQLQDFIDGVDQAHLDEQKVFHHLEQLRDRLCEAEQFPAALREACESWPELDREAVTRLARSVHANGDRRAFRELFKRLRQAWQAMQDAG
ncbi:UPF0307 protein [Desulfuromonas versatilis]|uniref:UPF0307 protein n=1 Tax=Desulfuromonas versatilis TaxID=2802975 RepID=A0ABN6DTQ6_9BACT|nr:ribosome biogenesis factor YjgA [Desulfuromonas versatilis]BCR03503.1 UPF0307 protein [Desulfuromonas versatilis]